MRDRLPRDQADKGQLLLVFLAERLLKLLSEFQKTIGNRLLLDLVQENRYFAADAPP